jgi:NAD(P)-dependent dehydrogenase (short-subunit alcohol dehydrogenase family)
MPVALITGASKGFGLAVARALAERGWSLVLDARHGAALEQAATGLDATVVPGDVADPVHRAELVAAVRDRRLDLLLNSASTLGPGLQPMATYDLGALRRVFEVDVLAPLALIQQLLPLLGGGDGTVVNVSSDAAVEAYEGWGAYGSAKSALDQLSAVLAVEQPGVRWYALDPGDMRTDLHQQAFPGQDISDRPEPAAVVPAVLRLLDSRPASGRYRAGDLLGAAR